MGLVQGPEAGAGLSDSWGPGCIGVHQPPSGHGGAVRPHGTPRLGELENTGMREPPLKMQTDTGAQRDPSKDRQQSPCSAAASYQKDAAMTPLLVSTRWESLHLRQQVLATQRPVRGCWCFPPPRATLREYSPRRSLALSEVVLMIWRLSSHLGL